MDTVFKQFDKHVDQLYKITDYNKFLKLAFEIKHNYLNILNADKLPKDIEFKHKPADVKNHIFGKLTVNDNRDFFTNIKLDLPKIDYLNTTEVDETLCRYNQGVLGQYVVEPDIRWTIYKLIYNENLLQDFIKVLTYLQTTKDKITVNSELEHLIRRFTNLNLVLLIHVLKRHDCVHGNIMSESLKEYIVHKCDPAFFAEIIVYLLQFGPLSNDLIVFIYKNAIPDEYLQNAKLESLTQIRNFSNEFQTIWRTETYQDYGDYLQRTVFDRLSTKLEKKFILRGFTKYFTAEEPSEKYRKLLQENCYFVNPGSFSTYTVRKFNDMPFDTLFALLCYSEKSTRQILFKIYFDQLSIYYAFISINVFQWEIDEFIKQKIPETNLAFALAFAKKIMYRTEFLTGDWVYKNLNEPSSFLKNLSIPNIVTARLNFPNIDKSSVPKDLLKASELANFEIPQNLNSWFIKLVNKNEIDPIDDDMYKDFTPMLWHYYILCLQKYKYDYNPEDVYDLLKKWSKKTTENGLYPETIVTLIAFCNNYTRLCIRIDELKIQEMSQKTSEELEWIVLWKWFNPKPKNFELFKVNTRTKLLFMLVMINKHYFRELLSDKVYSWLLDHNDLITPNIQLYIAHKYAYLSYFKTDWKNDDERLRFLKLFVKPDKKIIVFVDIINEKIQREKEIYNDQRAKLLTALDNKNFKKAQKISNFLKNRHLSRVNNDKELVEILNDFEVQAGLG